MAKLKKIKKFSTRSARNAERAQRAAERAEAAERRMHDVLAGRAAQIGDTDDRIGPGRPAIHTAPAAETR